MQSMISYSEYYTRHTFSISNSYILHLIFQQIPALFPQFIFFFAVKQKFTMFKIRRTAILRDENTASVISCQAGFKQQQFLPFPKHSSRKEKACSSIFFVSSSFSFRNLQTLPNLSPICSIPSATSEICSSFNWKKYSSRILICSSSLAASSAVRSSEQIFASSAFLLETINCSIASTLVLFLQKNLQQFKISV